MVTGIKIYNNAGTIQIDESYANFVLIDKQTYSISTPTTTTFDYTVTADVACVAVSVYPHTFTSTTASKSGSTWTFRLTFFNNPLSSGTCTFTVYAFGKPPAATETVGLKVQDASGNLVFHSQFKPLRIVGSTDARNSFSGPSGRTLAVLVLSLPMYGRAVFPGTVTDTYSMRVNGTTIDSLQTTIANIGNVTLSRDGLYAAVDVTNY